MGARHRRGFRGIPQGGLVAPDDGRHREGVGRLPLTIAKVLRFFEFAEGVATRPSLASMSAGMRPKPRSHHALRLSAKWRPESKTNARVCWSDSAGNSPMNP